MAAATSARRLVIVESPAKARNIASFLGAGYDVQASVGHIRDLAQPSELPVDMKKGPFGKFAVDVEDDFKPYYVVDADKKKKVAELKAALREADELFLATDEDREGEAIAWHLLEVLKPQVPVHRMVFHEITKEAIQRALTTTRDLDNRLVDAQETRRILDRLYGYEVSPVLWRKVRAGLSAGRVQSVATRMVVERERERMAFRSADYWDLTALLGAPSASPDAGQNFTARLIALDDVKIATGRDFTDAGELTAGAQQAGVVALSEPVGQALMAALRSGQPQVASVEEKPYSRRPAAPFITSTLQQEAGRKLRFSSRHAMRVAQSLYENGYITYMRTDSVTLSQQAIAAARRQASERYGPEYIPERPRTYASKASAQEAHEAIRPAGDTFRTPAEVQGELNSDQFKLYELIWKRTLASQMCDARGSTASVRVAINVPSGSIELPGQPASVRSATFAASGTVITFRGFLAAYEEGVDAGRGGGDESIKGADSESQRRLPVMATGDELSLEELNADRHQTSPPPRYTEASLVKALDERRIGRPSTYAAIISTIMDRGYVVTKSSALVPTWLAFSVIRLLEEHFTRLVDYDFTAGMEADLDQIASGAQQRVTWLQGFYFGGGVRAAGDVDGAPAGLKPLVENLGEIDARDINTTALGDDVVLRVGKYGPYLEAPNPEGGDPLRASVPDGIAPDELTLVKVHELLANQTQGDRELGIDPEVGTMIVARSGRFGPYVTELLPEGSQSKPRTGSLFKSMSPETVDLATALQLLALPREVGRDPESDEPITAQNGRYGPYLKKGTDSRSLTSEDQIFSITLDEALQIYSQPKQRGRAAAAPPLRELGVDPTSQAPIVVKDGRFGPYVTDGTTNATLRTGDTVEQITHERAVELLADRRARGPVKRGRKSTASTTAKKTTTKAATKKATSTKATAKTKAAPKKAASQQPTKKSTE